MKNIAVIIVIFLFLLASVVVNPVAAFAQEPEVGAAAQLAVGQILRDERIDLLRAYLTAHNSPLAGESVHFVAEADRLGLDWKLVTAIAGTESTFGKHTPPGSYNAWGWGIPTGTQSGIAFASWKQGITTVSEGLKNRYVDRGAVTIEQIGRIYAASPRWAGNVRFFLNAIDTFTPADPSLLAVTL
ncbi:glucosaminidase domain-containing protein [Candidatus Gottesmanbacteria bacterium]|nr:glucosaminidase domain-containing protein [Candidatus Gottesmanbacteria bacterium]